MIRRSTWITVLVFVILLAFAMYWSNSRTELVADPTPSPEALWQALVAEVESFTVENLESGETLQLRRDAEFGWILVKPLEGPANSGQVEQAVSWLANPVPTRILTPGENLEQYGLVHPRFQISIIMEGEETRQLEIGDDAPTGNSTYVQIPGDPDVYVVNRFSVESVINLVADEVLVTPTPEVDQTETVEPESP